MTVMSLSLCDLCPHLDPEAATSLSDHTDISPQISTQRRVTSPHNCPDIQSLKMEILRDKDNKSNINFIPVIIIIVMIQYIPL